MASIVQGGTGEPYEPQCLQVAVVEQPQKRQSRLLWPLKIFVLVVALITALVLNTLAFFS